MWLLFAGSDIYLLFIESYQMKVDFPKILPQAFFSGFVLFTFLYYRYEITKADSLNFTDLLWKVFITGLITTLLSLGIKLFFTVFANNSVVENPLTINFFYNILIGLTTIYMISTFVVWKQLILYQKSKNLLQLWTFFEAALFASLVLDLLGVKFLDLQYNIALIVLSSFSLILIFNLKWVAYLNFKQKWKGILFILLSGIYLRHFFFYLINFPSTGTLTTDLFDRVFIIGLFAFLFTYAIISILVILFNLPTSSVFERKLQETIDFQKLSQSIPRGETNVQTYEILLESSMSAVFADAAWLEIKEEDEIHQVIRNLHENEIGDIKMKAHSTMIKKIITFDFDKETTHHKFSDKLRHPRFKSIIALPIYIKDKQVGFIVLLNGVTDAFNHEMVNIITTFVNQASISLENLALIKESLENERYKEQLKIAKNVQKSLLPEQLIVNDNFEIDAFSEAADEIGGDYYDILQHDDEKFSLIIGDVSGKGTSAAFQMAQMKGVFHSLASQKLSPANFNEQANMALSECLGKGSFVTATNFMIDFKKKSIEFSRAGHCPTLFYCATQDRVTFLSCDGMGLGIVRNSDYSKYVKSSSLNYSYGDIMLLYTDGITEAKNAEGEQFGTERLKKSFNSYTPQSPTRIKEGIESDLTDFLGGKRIEDDYTLVVLKFKEKTKWSK